MALYKCDSCNEYRNDAVCPKCGSDTHVIDPSEASLEGLATAVSRNAGSVEPLARPSVKREEHKVIAHPAARRPEPEVERAPPAERQARPIPQQPAQQQTPTAQPETEIRGLDEFHALLDRGVKAVIVCGGGNVGKSHVAAGFIRANTVYRGIAQNLTLRATLRTDYVLGATLHNEVWYQIIDDKLTFLDPSGEFFDRLSLDYRQKYRLPDITDGDFGFVQRAVEKLAGIVLVVDLTNTIDPKRSGAWRQQEDDLKFVLSALRWLRWDKEARPPAVGLSANISQRASAQRLIDKAVLVLFTKADQLTQFSKETPLDFARRRLPTLHGALMTHARRFRYDFCHTMIRTTQGDQAVDYPCGVLLPIEWLLRDRFRWLPLPLPTRWIGGGK